MLIGWINEVFSKKANAKYDWLAFIASIYFTPPNSKKEFEKNYKSMKDSTG